MAGEATEAIRRAGSVAWAFVGLAAAIAIIHPVLVMLALLLGGTLGGFFGLLVAVPTAAILKIPVGHLWRVHVLGQPIEQYAEEAEAEHSRPAPGGIIREVV